MKDLLKELPPRIRKKIQIDPDNPGACWIWLGSVRAEGNRLHAARQLKDTRPGRARGRPRNHDVLTVHERAMPKVHSTSLRYPVPAHREIFALCHGIPYRDLARLIRCKNDLCVSPYHAHQSPHASTRTGSRREIIMTCDEINTIDPLEVLKNSNPRPFTGMSKELAAEEVGLDDIPQEVWDQFVLWDAENPAPDEE